MTISISNGSAVMMTLGQFQFGILTAAYQELVRSTEYRWPAQERLLQGAALQYVGPGEDTITLPGVIYPEFRGGPGQLDAMRALAGQGVPHTMIDGGGRVLGQWVITRVEEKGTVFGAAGVPRKQEFTLNLRKFEDGASGGGLVGSLLSGLNIGAALPIPSGLTSLASLTSSVASQSGGFAASLTSRMQQVSAVSAQIGSQASGVLSSIGRAADVARNLNGAAATAKSLLGSAPTTLSGIASASHLVTATSAAVNNATQAGASLKRSVDQLTALGTVPSAAIDQVRGAMVTANGLTVAAAKAHTEASKLLKGLNA